MRIFKVFVALKQIFRTDNLYLCFAVSNFVEAFIFAPIHPQNYGTHLSKPVRTT